MTDLIRQQKKDEIDKLNKELNELKDEEEEAPIEIETEEAPIKIEKPKRPRTEKQIKQFEAVRQRKMSEVEKRKVKREAEEKEAKLLLEKQLIEKAIKLKKKQINRMKIVEELSDDDTPTVSKPIVRLKQAPIQPLASSVARMQPPIDPYEAFKLKFRIN